MKSIIPNYSYHILITDRLLKNETVWDWFKQKPDYTEEVDDIINNINKENYAISREEQSELYASIEKACGQLSIPNPIRFYQSLNRNENNAEIIALNNQLYILFSGDILNLLNQEELESILFHELGHFVFDNQENKIFSTSNRIINAFANSNDDTDIYKETARRYQLYLELYCDRFSSELSNNTTHIISALIKLHTGLKVVSVQNYIEQAKELIKTNKTATNQATHPDLFIRCYALHYKDEKDLNTILDKHIIGNLSFNSLDILDQINLQWITYKMVIDFVTPEWVKISEIKSLYNSYFSDSDLNVDSNKTLDKRDFDKSTKRYLSFVLLDFCLINIELKDELIWQGKLIAKKYEFEDDFNYILMEEMNLNKQTLKLQLTKSEKEYNLLNPNPSN